MTQVRPPLKGSLGEAADDTEEEATSGVLVSSDGISVGVQKVTTTVVDTVGGA